jgi:ABC-type phosphate/phosphonate transport system substrate-binding protein
MRRLAAKLAICAVTVLAGCRAGGLPLINLLGLDKPVVVGLVADKAPALGDNPLELLNPFGAYEPMRKGMSRSLGRPVALDLCLEPLLEPNLRLGYYDFAIVTPAEYLHLHDRQRFMIAAIGADDPNHWTRSGVLIVATDTPIRKVEDLRGHRVAFGPGRNARTHSCALALLAQHGLKPADLSLDVLPIPGTLKVYNTDRSLAQAVMNNSADAGFVDEGYWDSLPQHDPRPDEPTRERFREVGRTRAIPDLLVIASGKPDAHTTEQVVTFLLSDQNRQAAQKKGAAAARYAKPTPDIIAACTGSAGEDETGRSEAASAPAAR